MRVLISGGGTGGHVNPAVSIANYLKEKDKNIREIAFAGTEKGLENTLVPKEGYKLYHLKVRGFQRKLSFRNIDALIKAFTSRSTAKKIIKEYKPDIVIGTGGYVSWPVLSVAAKMKIPTVIHEQNAFPGVTTKMLAKVVDRVMISVEESRKYFKGVEESKIIYTGNPVKSEFFNLNYGRAKKELSPNRPMILSYGGSLGARRINETSIELMEKYSKDNNISHYHATGSVGYKEFSEKFREAKLNTYENLNLSEYIFGMAKYIAAADIIICRAGALTLAELATARKAAVLIPSPYVAENHQYKNAVVLEKENAAVVIEERDLTGDLLTKKIDELLKNPAKLAEMAKNIGKFAAPDASEKIYKIILDCVR